MSEQVREGIRDSRGVSKNKTLTKQIFVWWICTYCIWSVVSRAKQTISL